MPAIRAVLPGQSSPAANSTENREKCPTRTFNIFS